MSALSTCLGIAFAVFFFTCIKKNINVIECVVFGLTGWLFGYIASTSVLLVFDVFSVGIASALTTFGWAFASAVSVFRKNRPSVSFELRPHLFALIIVVVMIPFFIHAPHEYFAMGQDEGVYQTEALMYMRGKTDKQFDFTEPGNITDQSFLDSFFEHVGGPTILGTFNYDSTNIFKALTGRSIDSLSVDSVTFHGLHTISAVLALTGKMFGISNMNYANAFVFALTLFWISFICRRLNLGKIASIAAIIVFALCPLSIWVAKSALTEPVITLMWVVFIFLILGKSDKEIILSALVPGLYGLYHISAYVFMPFFAALFIALYLYTGIRTYIKGFIIAVASFFVSFVIALINSAGYTFHTYSVIYKAGINSGNIVYVVSVACLVLIAAGAVLLKLPVKKIAFSRKALSIAMKVLAGILVIFSVYRLATNAPYIRDLSYLTIVSMAVITGLVIPVIVFISTTIFTDRWTDNKEHLILLSMFVYCIVLYSIMILPQIQYYYYYARYIAMYVPLIGILGAVCLDRMKNKLAIPALILTVCILLPHCLFLLRYKDDTRVQWDTIDEIEEFVQFDNVDAVFMRRELWSMFFYEFKSMDIDVYPITDDFEDNVSEVASKYEHIIIMDYTFDERFEDNYPIARRIFNLDTQDLGNYKSKIFRLPNGINYNSQTITLYRYTE